MLLAVSLVATGLVMSGLSLAQLKATKPSQLAQATQPAVPAPVLGTQAYLREHYTKFEFKIPMPPLHWK